MRATLYAAGCATSHKRRWGFVHDGTVYVLPPWRPMRDLTAKREALGLEPYGAMIRLDDWTGHNTKEV